MSRFFVPPEQVGAETITISDSSDLHHMRKVLRLQPGDEVDVSDGASWEYHARILSLDTEEASLQIMDKQSFATEPSTLITLYQGIPKQGKMETIIQKCVELGVHRIVPVFMDRTVVVDKGHFGKKIQRWQKVSAEAVKQCRRGIVPEVTEAVRMPQVLEELKATRMSQSLEELKAKRMPQVLKELKATRMSQIPEELKEARELKAAQDPDAYDLVLLPYENERGTTIKDVLRENKGAKRIAVLIGPEGGFSDAEANAVMEAGGWSVSLGKTTLRTETAGMAAIAMIMYEEEL